MNKAQELEGAENLLLAIVGEVQAKSARVFKVGNWCWFCGTEDALSKCNCGMPESLQCNGKRICAGCSEAHRVVATHLRKMFKAPIVDRSSSVRAKLYSQLHGAADELDEKNGVPMEGSLHLHLAEACPFDDEKSEFKGKIVGAFERSKFADFQGLAKELARETGEELKLKLSKWFSCIR